MNSVLPIPQERLAYSIAEAASLTGLGRTTLYGMMANGELASRKIGNRRIIPASELRRLVSPTEPAHIAPDR